MDMDWRACNILVYHLTSSLTTTSVVGTQTAVASLPRPVSTHTSPSSHSRRRHDRLLLLWAKELPMSKAERRVADSRRAREKCIFQRQIEDLYGVLQLLEQTWVWYAGSLLALSFYTLNAGCHDHLIDWQYMFVRKLSISFTGTYKQFWAAFGRSCWGCDQIKLHLTSFVVCVGLPHVSK